MNVDESMPGAAATSAILGSLTDASAKILHLSSADSRCPRLQRLMPHLCPTFPVVYHSCLEGAKRRWDADGFRADSGSEARSKLMILRFQALSRSLLFGHTGFRDRRFVVDR